MYVCSSAAESPAKKSTTGISALDGDGDLRNLRGYVLQHGGGRPRQFRLRGSTPTILNDLLSRLRIRGSCCEECNGLSYGIAIVVVTCLSKPEAIGDFGLTRL